MLRNLLEIGSTLLIEQVCPLCRRSVATPTSPPKLCPRCWDRLELPNRGFQGDEPLPWWSLGHYSKAFRHCLLALKRTPSHRILAALLNGMQPQLPSRLAGVLVPIPSWKRRDANPLPEQMAAQLGRANTHLLRRTKAGVSQHRLSRRQRLLNLTDAFQSTPAERSLELWLVDDILTTGATALAARAALTSAGHRVHGLICLARTPAKSTRL